MRQPATAYSQVGKTRCGECSTMTGMPQLRRSRACSGTSGARCSLARTSLRIHSSGLPPTSATLAQRP